MRTRYVSNTLHLESTTALYGPGVARTGFIESAILLALTSAGVSGAALGIGVTLLTAAVSIGASVGLSYLASSMFKPTAPRPEDVQQSVRQATAPRVRHYGRIKVSGPWVFAEAKAGAFYKVLAIGQGPIDAIEQYWVDDTRVTLDAAGWVQTKPWGPTPSGRSTTKCLINANLGEASEGAYSRLVSAIPGWTSSHRGNGVASLFAQQQAVKSEDYLSVFPNGINTNYRLVIRGAKVKNPVTGTTGWNDNAAAVIRDYITHADGMRLPESIVSTPLAQAGWVTAYNRATANIPLAAGGTEDRYRLWGSYSLEERPADVLGRMMACCDGRLVSTPDGGLTLDIGEWAEPTVTIDTDTITGFSELGRGRDILSTANTIRATYLEPTQDYQGADADPWMDAADVSDRGEITADMQFIMSPSHSQTRRLMKLAAFRANPTWVGQFQCNLRALAALNERFVRISYPLFGINSVFEVQDFRFNIGEGGILSGVTLQVQSMPSAAYEWDAAQEEGDAPVYDETEVDNTVPVPDAPTVGFVAGPVAELSFSQSPNEILFYRARYKKTADSTWTTSANLANDAASFTTGTLVASTSYDFQLAFVTEKGRLGSWSPSTTATTPAA